MAEANFIWGLGRRKTAVARVRIRAGSGKVEINGRPFEQYFVNAREKAVATQPLKVLELEGKFDVYANVKGGGINAQSQAVSLGLSRCLIKANAELEPKVKEHNLLTRDSRMKERKKYGRKGARKRFQFSKR
ncbi:MAG: 30S ribosomal protein S9 [Planctomycetaceae bacterium]|nr:30S ribosomal protein S9 [Planctomycetota bacterium]NUO15843.1 30S ribosomal protein S9 [Planctomycetaceae bacterium]GIK51089.1 MAG: 30S ribosomal protein S9 [Planctomycetota bacterium]HRJ77043.1 30S ribosomal protein S9 [Planctomycetota bacterium]